MLDRVLIEVLAKEKENSRKNLDLKKGGKIIMLDRVLIEILNLEKEELVKSLNR